MTHDEISNLTAAERLLLISELWDSIADADAPISEAQRDELARRMASFDEDKKHAVSWEALKAELNAIKR
jgi:putative addiction module component (TIGR02574 family)